MSRASRKPTTTARRLAAGVTAAAFLASQVAWPPCAEASHLGSSTASAGSAPPPAASAIQSFQPDLFTGRATTAIPIAVPPGRKGLQPSLALSYSSSGRNGWVGVGWSLDVGYIERSTKNGVPLYGSSDPFTFMFQGVASELVRIPDGTYRAEDEGLFLRFEHRGVSGWEVRDTSGTRYLFGQTVASQIEAGGRAFRWSLDQLIDPNGNSLTITYTKDQGQLYLSQIRYTGHEPTGLTPANQVDCILQDRPDVETSLRSGFPVTTAKRLHAIESRATRAGSLSLARRYDLAYTQSPRTSRSLLASVTQVGSDGTTRLPPVTFTYTQRPPTYLHCHNCVPSRSSGNHGWQLQTFVGHAFPKDDGGNDQRLWPGGTWEPGTKHWREKVCRRRLIGKSCHEEDRSADIPPVSWGAPLLERAGSSGGLSWSTDGSGNLTVSGPQDSHVLAMTWLYTTADKTIALSGLSTSGRADVFYVAPGGNTWSTASGNQVPLSPGWTVVAVTAYNELGGFSLSMGANLATQVQAMNHAQFSPMGLAGDFNGDGYTDLAHLEPATNHWHVLLNSGSGFGQEQTWLSASLSANTVPLVGDVDSDGKADLLLWNAASGAWQVAKSTGSSFQAPVTWHGGVGAGQTPLMGDFNGDQLLDAGAFGNGAWTVALSTGSSFGAPSTWLSGFGGGASPLTGDFNGDGLTDVGAASGGTISVALSNGTQLVPQPAPWRTGFGAGQALTSADLNGDGLTDALYYDRGTGTVIAACSTGQGFGPAQTLVSEHPFSLRGAEDVLQVGDFRGNGISGFGVFNATSGAAEIAFAMGLPPDLLEAAANGLGGKTALTYQPSSLFTNTNLHFAIPVVAETATSDGMDHTYTTRFTYRGGLYDVATKEFRGFQQAAVADAAGTTTTTTFAQDLHTKGRPLTTEVRDRAGRLFTKTVNTWGCTEPAPGVHFAHLDQTDSFLYDGDASFKQTRGRFTYDPYGNLTQTNEDGQVDPPLVGDERVTITRFTSSPSAWILSTPSLTQTLDAQGQVVAQRRFYYDGAPDPATPPTRGLLTTEEEWLDVDLDPVHRTPFTVNRWVPTRLTYDAYGNVKTVTDALNRTTTNTYDATGTYLTQIANVLGHTRHLAYDPRLGQVVSSADQNGVTTQTEYDALGRVTKVIGPTDTVALPTIEYEYDLSTVPTTTVTHTRVQSGSPLRLTHYAFHDGLGRTLQTRSPAEDPAKQVVAGGVELDSRGFVIKQWVPYLSNASSSYVPLNLEPSPLNLAAVSYVYDAIGRLIQTTDPDGSITLVDYHDGETTTTPPIGAQVHRFVDAHGRLIQVKEALSPAEQPITTYTYDALNNLTQVTDAKGNITRISYDSLGRKLAMDDPDMGVWTYAYDAVDNLVSQTDARGVTSTFTYDSLNRLTRKAYTVPSPFTLDPSPPVSYVYDDPTNAFAKGKLTGITDGSGASSFEYDPLGRLSTETKVLDGAPYTVHRSYDLLGRLLTLTYPTGELASYTYNLQGGLETLTLRSTIYDPPSTIISHVDYNAAGQLTKLTYGNGLVSDYAYDPRTLRLSSLTTRHSSLATTLQDFSYTFDALGNVTGITDAVHTGTQRFEYDPLNRLTRAVGSYGTSAYTYDAIGNMTAKEGATMTYGLADGSKPHAVTATTADSRQHTAHSWNLTYDPNGNLIKQTTDQRPQTADFTARHFTYDADNRLVEVKTPQEKTVTLTFQPGWNFFSLPVIPDDTKITSLFPNFSQDFLQISRLAPRPAPLAPIQFEHFVNHPKFNDFDTLDYGTGYEVYCKNPNGLTITLKGKLPTSQPAVELEAGWHLLAPSTLDPTPFTDLLRGVDATQVLRYERETRTLVAATKTEPDQAYFVQVRAASTWSPPLPADVTTRFVYDGDGGRVKSITAQGTTTFLGQSYEIAPDGKVTKYLFAGSQRIAAIETPPAAVASTLDPRPSTRLVRWWQSLWHGVAAFLDIPIAEASLPPASIRFYHGDHLGSSNLITDGAGQVVELAEYTPYGSLARREGTVEVPQKFTGQRLDASTGLYFYNARYYDPALGRFTQPDSIVQAPADPQSLNRYSYVRNNPVKYIDPSGHGWFSKFFSSILQALGILLAPFTAGQSLWLSFAGTVWSGVQAAQAGQFGAWAAGFAVSMALGAIIPVPNFSNFYLQAGIGALKGAAIGAIAGGVGSLVGGGSFGEGAGYGALGGAAGGAIAGIATSQQYQNFARKEGFLSNRQVTAKHYRQDLAKVRALSLDAKDQTAVTVGARPIEGPIPAGHRYIAAPNGNRFEMGPLRQGGPIVTSNTTDVSSWDTSLTTQNAIAAGLARTTTIDVSASGFVTSMGLYEAYWGGQPYQAASFPASSFNSNFAVNSVIYGAGGPEVKNLGYTPEFSQ